ncbi:hypothetical protein LIA77_00861 [Sarocladium implicatum]|nr:hypothetical protein LIA77_00861 [Sarocladium implicatum]
MASSEASRELYDRYKRDTQQTLHYMINTTNRLLNLLPKHQHDGLTVNETGKTTASAMVTIAKLIKKHVEPLPDLLFWYLRSVIEARTKMHQLFATANDDDATPDMKKSNDSHKAFINYLQQAFIALGGETWQPPATTDGLELVPDTSSFKFLSNRFEALHVGQTSSSHVETDRESGPDQPCQAQTARRKQARPGRGRVKRKWKRNDVAKGAIKASPIADEQSLESDVPVGDCGFSDDNLAAFEDKMILASVVFEMWQLRMEVQQNWCQVAYDGLNSAIAGALSRVAVAMIRRGDAELFARVPDAHSYEALWTAMLLSRNGRESVEEAFGLHSDQNTEGSCVLREWQLFYAFQDLSDFIIDYRKTHTGKPTKKMQAQLRD